MFVFLPLFYGQFVLVNSSSCPTSQKIKKKSRFKNSKKVEEITAMPSLMSLLSVTLVFFNSFLHYSVL